MKPKQLCSALLLVYAFAFGLKAAPLRDHGIDPAHLGKGDWISFFSCATNHFCDPDSPPDVIRVKSVVDIPTVLAYEKSLGMDYVIVKAGTGSTNYMLGKERQFTTNLVKEAHAVGLKIFGYTRSYGFDVPGEIDLATYVFNCGADGFVIDAEAEWESNRPWIGNNGPALATKLCEGIRNRYPNWFLAHSPMPVISYHQSFPYKEFGLYCDAVMPQLYWRSFRKTPQETVDWMDHEWKNFHGSLKGIYTNAVKPIVPVGPGGSGMVPLDVIDFVNYLKSDPNGVTTSGYRGVNFFRAGRYTPETLRIFRELTFAEASGNWKTFANVAASDVGDTSATINWSTHSISRCGLEFGTTTNYGTRLSDEASSFRHATALTNLSKDTIYHFRIRATNSSGAVEVSDDFLVMTLPGPVLPDVITDNTQATATGSWTIARSALDRHGKDYTYKTKGDGTGYTEFATNIPVSGNYKLYEMHTEGVNRSTRAPHIISYGMHVRTNYVNQKNFGGKWNLLGTFQVKAGDRFAVKVTDEISDGTVVVADAIKLSGYAVTEIGTEEADER